MKEQTPGDYNSQTYAVEDASKSKVIQDIVINTDLERIIQNYKLDASEIRDIQYILNTCKDPGKKSSFIAYFHNLFDSNTKVCTTKIRDIINDQIAEEEIIEIAKIFNNFLNKYPWEICLNLESIIEENK